MGHVLHLKIFLHQIHADMMNNERKLQLFALSEQLGNIGHWWVELPSQQLYWSDQVYAIHGVTRDSYEPTLESAIAFYHPNDRRRVVEYIERSVAQGKPFEFHLRIVRPDGDIRHVTSKAQCERDGQGNVTSIIGVFRDITEEETAKRTSKKMTSVNLTLMESSNDGFWDWHIQDDYEYMSPRFWEMLGYNSDEKPHQPSAWQALANKDDLAAATNEFQKHADTKGEHPYNPQIRFQHKDGSTVTVLSRGKIIEWDENGAPSRMVGSHTNITALKTSEQDLRCNLDFQTLLMNENTDLVFVKDEAFRIVTANKAFLALYPEDKRDSIIGTTTIEDYDEEQAKLFLAEDRKAFAEGVAETEEVVTFPDGIERTLLTRKVRFKDETGTAYILAVARDITKLKATEQSLREVNAELEEFAYRTSHDLRSPLVSSRRLLDYIASDINNHRTDKASKGIELVSASLEKLEKLVTEILQLTKLRYEEVPPDYVDVGQTVQNTLDKLSHMDGFDNIAFKHQCELSDAILLMKPHFEQIVENLISNAIKYQDTSKEQARVEILSEVTAGKLTFAVSDNGLGIPEPNRHQIFAMFKRFHSQKSFGTGLGLYMLKKSIERMQGTIEYTPLPDGTKFVVTLPLSQPAEFDSMAS